MSSLSVSLFSHVSICLSDPSIPEQWGQSRRVAGGDRNPMVGSSPRKGQGGAFGAADPQKHQDPLAWAGGVILILRHGWRVLPLSPRALVGRGSGSAHLAARLRLAWGTSGRADVGARQGGRQQLCVSVPLSSPLSPPWVVGHPSSLWAAVGWEGGDTRESHPIPLWGWGGSSARGGPGSPQASQSLARHGDLLFCLRCQAARVEGPYGPLCASLINPGMQVRRCKSR